MKTSWVIAAASSAVALVAVTVSVVLIVTRQAESPPATVPAPTSTASTAPIPATRARDGYARWSSADVLRAFGEAGLEVGAVVPLEPRDQGLAPVTEREGVRFLIPSLGRDAGGRIFSFADPQSLAAKRDYYSRLGRATAVAFSWLFDKGNVLVQINGALPRARAQAYADTMQRLR